MLLYVLVACTRSIVLKYIGYNTGSRRRRECNSISRRYRGVHLNTQPIMGRKNLFETKIYALVAYRALRHERLYFIYLRLYFSYICTYVQV